jgi:hypothetical protein
VNYTSSLILPTFANINKSSSYTKCWEKPQITRYSRIILGGISFMFISITKNEEKNCVNNILVYIQYNGGTEIVTRKECYLAFYRREFC